MLCFMKNRPVSNELLHAEGRTVIQAERKTERKTNKLDEFNCRFS